MRCEISVGTLTFIPTDLAWFITRPGGNVMIDVPQYDDSTADALAEMGGVQVLMVTHQDSAGDHARWLQRCARCCP